jgi:hypothetical protein
MIATVTTNGQITIPAEIRKNSTYPSRIGLIQLLMATSLKIFLQNFYY